MKKEVESPEQDELADLISRPLREAMPWKAWLVGAAIGTLVVVWVFVFAAAVG